MASAHFYGSADHSIDEKNRITVPAQFRLELGSKFFLCKGMNNYCLWLLPEEEFKLLLERMENEVPECDEEGQKWIALFTESAVDRELDKFNRIMLPLSHLEYAGITDKIKIYGRGKRIEIWALERWQKEMETDFRKLSSGMLAKYMRSPKAQYSNP